MVNQERDSVNIPSSENYANEEIMVSYDRVLLIAWDSQAGKRLQMIRESKDISRPKLEDMCVKLTGSKIFTRYTVKSLELGIARSVSTEILDHILALLGSNVSEVIPTMVTKNFTKTP